MNPYQSQLTARVSYRHGLTIMEVMIAIGVILVGLVGISALIPIAAEDASASIRTDAAVRYGSSITADLRSRNVGALRNVVRLDVDPRNDDGLGANTNPVFQPVSVGTPNDSPSMRVATVAAGVPRGGNLASYCIDPLMLAQHQRGGETSGSAAMLDGTRNGYQRNRFPYYNEFYTGLTEPNLALGGVGSGFPLPRMWRISYAATSGAGFIPPALAGWLTSSDSELSLSRADDRLDPVGQIVNIQQRLDPTDRTSPVVSIASRQTENRFSWFATLSPPPDASDIYKMSTVVVERRSFLDSPQRGDCNAYTARNDRENFQGERIAWVADAISLGSVTEVEIYANELVSDKIVANQWVMLSAQAYNSSGTFAPVANAPAIHRWFRVVQVGPAEHGEFSVAPAGTINGWKRRVVLDGPTWVFGFGDSSLLNDTFMTIVEGAIAVIESDIRMQ